MGANADIGVVNRLKWNTVEEEEGERDACVCSIDKVCNCVHMQCELQRQLKFYVNYCHKFVTTSALSIVATKKHEVGQDSVAHAEEALLLLPNSLDALLCAWILQISTKAC